MGTDAGRMARGSRVHAILSRALALALWGTIGLALVLGVANWAGGAAGAGRPPAGPPAAPPAPPPGGCAELVVAAWLAGDTGALAGVPGAPAIRPAAAGKEAARTWVATVTPGSTPDRWGFLIGADVRVPDGEGGWRPEGIRYFAVTMVRSPAGCDGWSPAGLPALMPPPPPGGGAPEAYPVRLASSGTTLAETLDGFFAAMLAGGGSLERYLAPTVTLTPIEPPPYQEVRLLGLAGAAGTPDARGTPPDGTTVRLLATVATGPDGLPLAYPVTAGVRGGRWEVVAIDPVVGSWPAGQEPTGSGTRGGSP